VTFYTIQAVLADDHPAVIAGLRHVLETSDSISVAGVASNPTELFYELDRVSCDVLVSDFTMPDEKYGDGFSLFTRIKRNYPDLKIVVMSALESPVVVKMLLDMGVRCVVSKADPIHHLTIAMHVACAGGEYLSPFIRKILGTIDIGSSTNKIGAPLSKRELEVVRLFVSGKSVGYIAKLFYRSVKTVSTQKKSAMAKLNVNSDSELVRYMLETGLVGFTSPADKNENITSMSDSSVASDIGPDSGLPGIDDASD
jgi:two-component system, NarL family, captular synthesis response regulator RcsB